MYVNMSDLQKSKYFYLYFLFLLKFNIGFVETEGKKYYFCKVIVIGGCTAEKKKKIIELIV